MAFSSIESVCGERDKEVSITVPGYLNDCTCSTGWPLILRGWKRGGCCEFLSVPTAQLLGVGDVELEGALPKCQDQVGASQVGRWGHVIAVL